MCLILFALDAHPRYRLALVANRDEFYARPTRSLHWWDDAPDVLGGKDLEAGGSWFGIHRDGRFAALTNYREPKREQAWPTSRGELVHAYLMDSTTPQDYAAQIAPRLRHYAGFNLLLGNLLPDNRLSLLYISNRGSGTPQIVQPGVHGISNALLDTPWPKVALGREALAQAVGNGADPAALFAVLADDHTPADDALPDTGVGLELERLLGSRFIRGEHYGTRASTVLLIDHNRRATVYHRDFGQHGTLLVGEQEWSFALEP